ncbi:Lrp/AsnC family transcriptional regulator, leucine-responsive regulatory protein [Daejeonella rubra]|uniref:Lrp/AsnC family transcriptional regulator, leucine-responsive regulatory protein n=1 Tax=Daejeonella rubra TaxID=990371 RepID=A0A1G9U4T6_9SPHI|nr:Lrp/AsnC family transcriptional regulator [Daejeonella rubra]SDM54990.1 Lrp/AsnC family transcriptional regulator, leucine-responsive regulatory protein [Daejeonella rubra]
MHQKEHISDKIDLEILSLMQENSRISNADIARVLNMAPSAVLERVKKLEQKNIILQYTTRLNPLALNQNLLAYVYVKASNGIGISNTAIELAKIAEVQEVHQIAGDDCFIVKIRTTDSASLLDLLRNTMSKIPDIVITKTTLVLETIKEQQQLVIHQ